VNALRKKWNSLMRKLLLVLLILPLLLLAVSIGFVLLVDPNDYREELEGIGSDLLGRKLVIRGAMKIVPGLVPGLSMADVTVGNPDWAHDPYLAKLEQIEGRIELLQALRGNLELAHLTVSGGEIFLEDRPDGTDNYTFAESGAGTDETDIGDRVPRLRLRDITISHRAASELSWGIQVDSAVFDKSPDNSRRITADGIFAGVPISMEGTRGIQAGSPWQWVARIKDDAELRATGRIRDLYTTNGLPVTASGPDVGALSARFGLTVPVSDGFELKGNLRLHGDTYALDSIEGTVAKTDVKGELSVVNGASAPRIDATFASQTLEFTGAWLGDSSGSKIIPEFSVPVEALRAIDLDIDYRASQIISEHGALTDLKLKLSLVAGRLNISEISATDSSGASLHGQFELDASGATPNMTARLDADSFDLGLLLKTLGWFDGIQEQIDIDLKLAASGHDRASVLSGLTGRLVIVSGGGSIDSKNFDLWAADLVTTMLSPKWRGEDNTTIECGVVGLEVKQGVATVEHLLVDTERITIGGSGSVNLIEETFDLVLAPQPKKASLVSLARPVRIAGPWSAPDVATIKVPTFRRMAKMGTLAVLNPVFLVASFSHTGQIDKNACIEAVKAVQEAFE